MLQIAKYLNRFSILPIFWTLVCLVLAQTISFAQNSNSAHEVWVAHYASELLLSSDEALAMAIDGQGNLYVTGKSEGEGNGEDYVTVKYNSLGIEQWVARYNGPGNLSDEPTALAVDDQGNVYVTGRSYGFETELDYATVKYNSMGIEQWVARYNGPHNFDDAAYDLAVDDQGNVYVTGSSNGSENNYDYATIKYNTSGTEQWVALYNGPDNSGDIARTLVVDDQSNVYVTGSSDGSETEYDYATVKYNSSGVEQWIARYDGPGNLSDEATALAVDEQGNVYVTGSSIGLETDDDYATIKYDTLGTEQWVARYNGPGNSYETAAALVIDQQGNVYVTGGSMGSENSYDYATVKYNSSGDEQWIARYNGPDNSADIAAALALDQQGNVYVAGNIMVGDIFGIGIFDFAMVKYDSLGIEQWVVHYEGSDFCEASAFALDDSSHIYVSGTSENDFTTIKYNSSGVILWVSRYDGPRNSYDWPTALAVDNQGNVYVTGSSEDSEKKYDYVTAKYNSSGIEQWVARYNGPSNFDDAAYAMAIDDQGNVYVTGASYNLGSHRDYCTVKYDSSGTEQWVALYNGPANSDDWPRVLTTDHEGNIYVTGKSKGSGTKDDYATIKYNSSGTEQWVARYNGPGNSGDLAASLVVDSQSNVYVTGHTDGDYATIKYNPLGLEQWVARYIGPADSSDLAHALAVDDQGNVYVTGGSIGLENNYDYATIKYDTSGTEQWVARYNGPGNLSDEAIALAVDDQGNVYVTGHSYGSETDLDYATIKYNTLGVEQWVVRYNGPGNSADLTYAFALDEQGNAYVTGGSGGSEGDHDYATVKYNSSGIEQWVTRYRGPGNSNDYAKELALDNQGNVYVTGQSNSIMTTIKYSQSFTGMDGEIVNIPVTNRLEQNFPNPFNPSTTIEFTLPKSEFVELKLYNILGKEVSTLVSKKLNPGNHTYTFDGKNLASGVYYYRLEAGNFVQTRKMIYLK